MDQKDILTDIFSTLRMSADLYFGAAMRGAFSVQLPVEKRRIRFHLVRRGTCWIRVPGQPDTELEEDDLAIVPHGAAQILSSEPHLAATPLADIIDRLGVVDGVLSCGETGPRTELLCGFCRFDEAVEHPVTGSLPGLLVVRSRHLAAEPWTRATLQLMALEADLAAPGTTGILSRLIEILFIQTLRNATSGPEGNGYAAALADLQLARALQAVHDHPDKAWTVQSMARTAGMSRARFADRFGALVGVPPIEYLTRWRLMKARMLLSTTDLDMQDIAERCGYASVPSFTRRFKRAFGIGPGTYRRNSGRM